jgi:hypothetical protein
MVMKHESAQALEVSPLDAASEGTWLVKTRGGIHTCTLDELDLAFQRGQIDASTPVFTAGMTEWQTLGVMADLEAPAANDTAANDTAANDTAVNAVNGTSAATPEPSSPRSVAPPPRHPPPPPTNAFAPSPFAPPQRRVVPPPLTDGRSFPPTTTAVFGNGASVWTSITTPEPELETGVRRNASRVPFAVRRRVGSVFDFGSNFMAHLRAVHPRWAAVGPWLFGAALSGIFVFALYQLANAPAGPGVHTRSGPAVSYAAASATVSSAAPSVREPAAASAVAPSAASASPSNGDVARPASPAADDEPVATTRAASIANDDTDAADEGSDVLRTRDLKFASSRSERQATSSGRSKAKAKAWSKRAKARAARKARRSQRAHDFAE